MGTTKLATLGVLFTAFVWGIEFVLIHNAITVLEPHSFNVVRFGIASLFVWLCLLFWKSGAGFSRRMIWHGGLLGALLFLGFSLQTFGLLYTSVSNCAFITSLNVVLVPLLAFVLLGDRPRILTLIGVAVAAGGLYLLTAASSAAINVGDLLTLVCALMFALHIIYTGKYSRQHEALYLILVQLLTVTLVSFGSALLFEDWGKLLDVKVVSNHDVLLASFVAAILGTGVAILLQTLAQVHLSSTRVALIYSLEPIFAALTAYLVLNEQLPAAAGLGAGMILAGIILAELPILGAKPALSVEQKGSGSL